MFGGKYEVGVKILLYSQSQMERSEEWDFPQE